MSHHTHKGTEANDRLTGFGRADDAHEPTLIWSGEHQAWWRAPANGYTTDIFAAGVYPRDEARRNTSHCGPEKRIALQSAEKMLREHLFGLSQAHPDSVFHELVAIVPRELIQRVCDVLAERKHGSPARSPAHNARLMLENALRANGTSQADPT